MVDEPFIYTKLLIIGKTYPNHSVKYRETACTGAMRYDTFEMLRNYPIPYRSSSRRAFLDTTPSAIPRVQR